MAQKDYYAKFAALQDVAQDLTSELAVMKDDISHVLEENAELKIENEHLRSRLAELDAKKTPELPEARRTLEKLYEQGFHVCTVLYGAHRENNEECAFCLDVIYGERNSK
ncbi:MAG: DNA replication initiation control protein YabA [Lactobacillus sp.]|jgi:regulator of replication initiation timing|uniref:DNA replication initiation control protein YabA n=1 Tax=Bombilactobacillus bombi TaxID=1303590 RepID=A0A347SQ49_9LACO|nr:DNA replication initiation control protein YabA [Bombilactobacillus bombi]MCO6541493.1 DNA replication initiation control protein YabA [Lactobacillus sp.]AXX64158.1 DNA replication initiation control protein YabA [Bombilactobacillus bombi]MCO6543524.1 DNA replication initiation control protein YabA [Lactobacillus sp.]RHW45058.1 DNA replication initiation control protein YabA [Bombilactobacillus bombi]RHW51836.1 DNA replication initiation control protein YabA [Bombilactobacillus bombi]